MARPTSEILALVSVRDMRPGDMDHVRQTFLRTMRSAPYAWHLSQPVYEECFKLMLADAVSRSKTLVACLKEDERAVVAWSVVQDVPEREGRIRGGTIVHPPKKVVHYVHVDEAYRELGLMRLLLRECGIEDLGQTADATVVRKGQKEYQTEPTVEGSFRHNRLHWIKRFWRNRE